MKSGFNVRLWEYFWYLFTTVFLVALGVLLAVLFAVRGLFRFRGRKWSVSRVILWSALGAFGIAGLTYISFIRPVNLGNRAVLIVVKPGDHFATVADQLVSNGVVHSKLVLKFTARMRKIDTKLLPGEYIFKGRNSAWSVLDKIERGEGREIRVTVVEGLPIWRVASVLRQELVLDSVALIRLNTDRAFLDSLEIPQLEGYLFPETYLFPPGIELRRVVRDMVAMFHSRTDSLFRLPLQNGLTKDQTIVLASIIEAETPLDSEKPRVAAVYLNRLKLGMFLDADPTVIYGLGGLNRLLVRADLDSVSPYNTYRSKGLPPTPINSPGLESVRAAVHPDTSSYLYFVADGTGRGSHFFSYSNEEHNTARLKAKLNERANSQ